MSFPALLAIPLIAGITTQVIKFLLRAFRGQVRWSALQEYGGMPSAHTAFVVSLTTVVGRHDGIASATFAMCVIFSLLIIRDAIGLRQYLSQHGKMLNMLLQKLPSTEAEKNENRLVERFGHTPLQAFVGGCIGLVIALGLYQVWPW